MKFLLTICVLMISTVIYAQTFEEYYNSGNEKAAAKDYKGSIKDYDKAIKANPSFSEAYYNRGSSKIHLNDFKSALADFDKAIELRPDFISAYRNRGILRNNINDHEGAIADLDMAIKLEPNGAASYYLRGQIKLSTQDLDGGCADLTKAQSMGEVRAEKFIKQYCTSGSLKQNNATESLALNWPDDEGWKVASNQKDNEHSQIELLRNNETFDNWTEIGTMMTYPALHNIPMEAAMNAMHEQAKKKGSSSAKLTFIEKDEKDKYPWIIFTIESRNESQLWYITQGSDALYVSFRAIKQKAIPEGLKTKWTTFFKTAKIVVN